MKNIGIITINDNDNYGNRLQNYALEQLLNKIGVKSTTIKNIQYFNNDGGVVKNIKNLFLYLKNKMAKIIKDNKKRKKNFDFFNKNINFSKKYVTFGNKSINDDYDFFVAGSDQIWKPTFFRFSDVDLLKFCDDKKKVSYAASFGIEELPRKFHKKAKEELSKFKSISVRENAGKKIIHDIVGRDDVEVLIDPTMLLTSEEWDKVAKKPKMLKCNKYILNYFLGNLSEIRREEINRIAKENNCEVINILDKNNPFYECGPSEFLYLEKNAFLICTDSFHSSVFAILYDRPFIIFDREQQGMNNMNSRLDTLIDTFKLKNRRFTGKITKTNMEHNYLEAYEILKHEREKSKNFLKKALDIKD